MKTLRLLCCLCLCFTLLTLPCRALALEGLRDGDIAISAPSAILMEKTTGQVLYEKNADERLPPASVTKIMTLLLIIEDIEAGKLALDNIVTASARAASFGGSCVYLEQGEQMSVHEMLKCIAVASANDCAVAMAEQLAGTEELFVERMNARAGELGLQNTHFTNCTGLFEDESHYSSARDIALLSCELLRHPLIKDYSTIWMDSIRNGSFGLTNTNKLVYWYQGCTGLKTGFTNAAMYCLAASAEREGVEYVAVIMHADSIDARSADATALLNYAFARWTLCSLRPEAALPEVPVELGSKETVPLRIEGEEAALVPRGSAAPSFLLELPERVSAPIEAGQRLGSLHVQLGTETLAVLPLAAAEAVSKLGVFPLFTRLLGSLVGL